MKINIKQIRKIKIEKDEVLLAELNKKYANMDYFDQVYKTFAEVKIKCVVAVDGLIKKIKVIKDEKIA